MPFRRLFVFFTLLICLLGNYLAAADTMYGWEARDGGLAVAGNGDYIYGTDKISLRFKVSYDGSTLKYFHFKAWTQYGTPPSYVMDIQSDNGAGLPSGTSLSTTVFTPTAGWNRVELSSPLSVIAGVTYHVVLYTLDAAGDATNNIAPSYQNCGPRRYYVPPSTVITERKDEDVWQWKGAGPWAHPWSDPNYGVYPYVLEYSNGQIYGSTLYSGGYTGFGIGIWGDYFYGFEITPASNLIVKGFSASMTDGYAHSPNGCYLNVKKVGDPAFMVSKLFCSHDTLGWNASVASKDFGPEYPPAVLLAGTKYRFYFYQGNSPELATGTGLSTQAYGFRPAYYVTTQSSPINYNSLNYGAEHQICPTKSTNAGTTWSTSAGDGLYIKLKMNDNPTVSGIQPSTFANTSVITMTISGTSFAGVAGTATEPVVTLTRASYVSLTAAVLTVESPLANKITCTFNLTDKAPGIWDVCVTNVDGKQGFKYSAFTLTAGAPVITTYTPLVSGSDASVATLTINGSNFFTGSKPKLRWTGTDSDIEVTPTTLATNQMIATFSGINLHSPGGGWSVLVTAADGVESSVAGTNFTITATSPIIAGTSPTSLSNTGTGTVTITGSRICPSATVVLTNQSALENNVSGTVVTIIPGAPATLIANFNVLDKAPAENWRFRVTNTNGLGANSANFTIKAAGPSITNVTPQGGSVGGLTTVTISGTNFFAGASTSLTCATLSTINGTLVTTTPVSIITCVFNLGGATSGWRDLVVTNNDTKSTVLTQGFGVGAPSITAINPATVANSTAAVTLTITGNYFQLPGSGTTTTTLTFAGRGFSIGGTSVTATSTTTVTGIFDINKKAPGVWDLIVTNPDTLFTLKTSLLTITAAAPAGLSTSPSFGTNTGSRTVTVTGTNIYPGATVRLTKASLPDITGTGNTVLTPGVSMSTVFDLTGKAPANDWQLVLTNTDAQSVTQATNFTIIAEGGIGVGSITPNIGSNNQISPLSVSLTGSSIYPGVALALTSTTLGTINGTSVTASSQTAMSGSLPLYGKPAGVYNVVIGNTDGSLATIVNGFTVTRAPEIIRIIPSTGFVDQQVDGRVEGVSFASAAGFKIAKSGQTDIVSSNVTVYRTTGATTISGGIDASAAFITVSPLCGGTSNSFLGDEGKTVRTAMTIGQTTSTYITSNSGCWVYNMLRIDDEIIRTTYVVGYYELQNTSRAMAGSTASAHASSVGVFRTNAAYLYEDRFAISTDLGLTCLSTGANPDSRALYSKAGVVKVGTDAIGYELVSYTDTSESGGWTTRLLNCTRGAFGTSARDYTNVASSRVGVVEVRAVKIDDEVIIAETSSRTLLRVLARGAYGTTAVTHVPSTPIYSTSLMGAGFTTEGAALGVWDAVITNPDSLTSAVSSTTAFTIDGYDPTVSQVAPNTVENSGTKTLTVTAENLRPDAFVTLIKSGESNVNGTSTTVVTGLGGYIICTVNVLGKAIGPWDVRVTNLAEGLYSELGGGLTIENSTPVVTAINPATGANTEVITATINGTFFRVAGNPSIALSKLGQPADINGTSVSVTSVTTATCLLNLSGMGPGTWNVVYFHDDGKSGSLADGFIMTSDLPVLTGINPNIAGSTGVLTCTLSGTGFFPGLTTKLKKGSSIINGTNISFVNSALFKTATASSTYSTFTPPKAVDGSVATYWESTAALPVSLAVNLGTPSAITKVIINWDNTYYGKNYTIDVAPDGNTWSTAASIVSLASGGPAVHFLNNTGNFARIRVTTGSSGSTVIIKEFEVYTSNSVACNFNLTSIEQGSWSPYVTNSDGNESYLADGLKVYGVPVVNTITPLEGLNNAVNTITVTGDNFVGVSTVKFNDALSTAATGYTIISNYELVATFPAIDNSGRFDPIITALGGANTTGAQHFDLLIPKNKGTNQDVTFSDGSKVVVEPSTFSADVAVIVSQTFSDPGLVATANSGIKGNLIKVYPAITNNVYELSLSKTSAVFNPGNQVTFKVKYNGINDPNIEKNLRVFELDTSRQMWKVSEENQTVDMVAKTVSLPLSHFSYYRLAYAGKYGSDLSDAEGYPNPVTFDTAYNNTLKFVRLVANTNINIYTLSGELVLSLPFGTNNGKTFNDAANGVAEWDGTNTSGEKVTRGLYVVLFRDDAGHHSVKKIVVK